MIQTIQVQNKTVEVELQTPYQLWHAFIEFIEYWITELNYDTGEIKWKAWNNVIGTYKVIDSFEENKSYLWL